MFNGQVNANSLAAWIVQNGNLAFEVVGTLAFALSGLIEAARKRLDFVGMVMVASLAAFGGGTLRDVLLGRHPLFWIENWAWVWVMFALCALAMLFMRARHLEPTERGMQWPDALGLGIFAAGGTQISLEVGVEPIIAVIMGTLTAVFGGVLRDVVVNEIPKAFSDHRPYSVIAFAGGWVVVAADALNTSSFFAVAIGALVIVALRVIAILFSWRLPVWRLSDGR